MNEEKVFGLIKLSLWGYERITTDWDAYEEMKRHAIATLCAPIISSLDLSAELKEKWKTLIVQQLTFCDYCSHEQSVLPISTPYVILKGTSAAKYYPYPEYRMLGDIDIMTRREDLEKARQQLIVHGYTVVKELNREITLVKNGIVIELHRRFASINDPMQAQYLDDLITENINPSHVLPDLINGLVILEHISQHMEGGLGLRQIIDWMMFVNKCLPDERWPEFREKVQKIGLENLAIVTTRMCEIYLGLPQRNWCTGADFALCEQLMDYVMKCGNFGNKKTSDTDISENAFAYASTLRTAFKLLQNQGLTNWKLVRKYTCLRPFAWIYQMFRYIHKGFHREKALYKLKKEYSGAKKRKRLFDELGVRTTAKGNIIIQDGKYIKE